MGQAKSRGSFAQRQAEAQAAQENEEPINVPCKTCQAPLNGFSLLRTTPAGAAWQKVCDCGATTTALVQAPYSTLHRTFKATLSMAKDVTGDNSNKVSVSFLEKSIDTVETGIVRF